MYALTHCIYYIIFYYIVLYIITNTRINIYIGKRVQYNIRLSICNNIIYGYTIKVKDAE